VRLALWAGGGVGALVLAALFLVGLAVKELDNRFCVACHLHEEKLERLTAAAPSDLAGFHHRRDASVGCIACHGGVDPVMRAKVWTVAAFDTVKFLAGAYAEPTRMKLQLGDPECRQCHTPIVKPAPRAAAPTPPAKPAAPASASAGDPNVEMYADPHAERGVSDKYHGIREHDTANLRCVRCHTSHTTDSDAKNRFISQATVRPACRECHKEMLGALRAVR